MIDFLQLAHNDIPLGCGLKIHHCGGHLNDCMHKPLANLANEVIFEEGLKEKHSSKRVIQSVFWNTC